RPRSLPVMGRSSNTGRPQIDSPRGSTIFRGSAPRHAEMQPEAQVTDLGFARSCAQNRLLVTSWSPSRAVAACRCSTVSSCTYMARRRLNRTKKLLGESLVTGDPEVRFLTAGCRPVPPYRAAPSCALLE